jgi:hypothetical protein
LAELEGVKDFSNALQEGNFGPESISEIIPGVNWQL